jgi:formylglycine-generating enzyme required for sulfatase activity
MEKTKLFFIFANTFIKNIKMLKKTLFILLIILENNFLIGQKNAIDSLLPEMVFVEGGTFKYGFTNFPEDLHQEVSSFQEVSLNDFSIGKYEVTQSLWQAIMGNNPSNFNDCPPCPIENISWTDANDFIAKLNTLSNKNFRLPTSAEWEYAAKGGNKTQNYRFSGGNYHDDLAWVMTKRTHPIGQKNPNELNVFDMTGNVQEWCHDNSWSSDYKKNLPIKNPQGPDTGQVKIVRGGMWMLPWDMGNVAISSGYKMQTKDEYTGFRLAMSGKVDYVALPANLSDKTDYPNPPQPTMEEINAKLAAEYEQNYEITIDTSVFNHQMMNKYTSDNYENAMIVVLSIEGLGGTFAEQKKKFKKKEKRENCTITEHKIKKFNGREVLIEKVLIDFDGEKSILHTYNICDESGIPVMVGGGCKPEDEAALSKIFEDAARSVKLKKIK